MKTKHVQLFFLFGLISCCLAADVLAQRPDRPGRGQRPAVRSETDGAATEKKDSEDSSKKVEPGQAESTKMMAIVGGEIHTATGEVIRRGTVLVEDGKIKAIGRDITIPDGAEIIDATNRVVTPGFVAINMSGIGVRGSTTGNNQLADALDPFDRNLKYGLGVGITTGCIELARAGGGGRRRGSVDEMPYFPNDLANDLANNLTGDLARASESVSERVEIAQMDNGVRQEDAEASGIVQEKSESGPREITLTELMGVELREGEPEHRFLGIDPEIGEFVTETQIDYGLEDPKLCPCCDLPILPTEPIEAAPPTQAQPRRHAVIKLSFGHLEDMLITEQVFYSPSPGALTGALNRHNWRRAIKSAKEEIAKAENPPAGDAATSQGGQRGAANRARGGATGGAPQQGAAAGAAGSARARTSNNPLIPLLKKEVALRVTANTASEILDMVALAEELDYNLIIEGGIEAWLVAPELSRSGTQVVFSPRSRRNPRVGEENSSGSSIESTGTFQQQGVPFATSALSNAISMGGLAGRDLTSLPLEAAFAVRGGASNLTALQSITIVPARMMGLDDRIGTLEVGKDADILILNGEPLDYRSYVETAIVAGKICYERETDQVYPVYERH